jgi:hypothetical protein
MKHIARISTVAGLLLVALLSAGCPNPPVSGSLPTPVFRQLRFPTANGGWQSTSEFPLSHGILPTRGRAVRVDVVANLGVLFGVGLRTLDGVLTALPQNSQTPMPPAAGYFEIIEVATTVNPPVHVIHIRAPLALSDPTNYSIEIVNRSQNTSVTDSPPLVIPLRAVPNFKVTVTVQGQGRVTSTPPGITCGVADSGRQLTECSAEFASPVSLAPQSVQGAAAFRSWGGNCDPQVQTCQLALSGNAQAIAIAKFGASGAPASAACPTAPVLPGLHWIDAPNCATNNIDQHPGITLQCDAQGYFCCEPGPSGSNAPRCGGSGKIESAPDCRHHAPTGMLRQPGGCYEVDP